MISPSQILILPFFIGADFSLGDTVTPLPLKLSIVISKLRRKRRTLFKREARI